MVILNLEILTFYYFYTMNIYHTNIQMNLAKKTLFISLILFSTIYNKVKAQDYSLLAGARSEGLAHSSVALENAFSTFHNPSTLAWIDQNILALSVRSHFGVSNLNSAYISTAFTNFGGATGLTVQWQGGTGYHDTRFGLYYTRPFGEICAASFTVNVYQHFVQGYDLNHAVTGDLGLTAKGENFGIGLYWGNMGKSGWSNGYQQELPIYLRLGGRYNFSEDFLITGEAVYDASDIEPNTGTVTPENTFGFRGGIEYIIDDVIGLRFGMSNLPKLTSGGISLYLEKFRFDIATGWHPQLGFSPHGGIVYEW